MWAILANMRAVPLQSAVMRKISVRNGQNAQDGTPREAGKERGKPILSVTLEVITDLPEVAL
jgi:hypothetical protein